MYLTIMNKKKKLRRSPRNQMFKNKKRNKFKLRTKNKSNDFAYKYLQNQF